MVNIYTHVNALKEKEKFCTKATALDMFYKHVLIELDFEKYEDIFQHIEIELCKRSKKL
jgi:hypothetical protein